MGTVAVVCSDHSVEDWVFRALDGALVIVDVAPADVMVITEDCLDAIVAHVPAESAVVVVGEPTRTYSRADFVITRAWRDVELRWLLVVLADRKPSPLPSLAPPDDHTGDVHDAQRALLATEKLVTAMDLATTETMAIGSVVELVDADRGYCLYYDASRAALWSEWRGGETMPAIVGIAAWVARVGQPVVVPVVAEDARFCVAIDDPQADRGDHLVAQPILGGDGLVQAVLVVARRADRPMFENAELRLLRRFAQLAAPVLEPRIAAHHQERSPR